MAVAAALVGVDLVDHLVLGANRALGVAQSAGRMVMPAERSRWRGGLGRRWYVGRGKRP